MSTLAMLDAIVDRLKKKMPMLTVEYFPEKPETYRLNHPIGALLLSYAGSRYSNGEDTLVVAQERALQFTVTLVLRQLHGRNGAVETLDMVRRSLIGFRLPYCSTPIRAVSEVFLGHIAGLWQYALDVSADAAIIEDSDILDRDPLQKTSSIYEEENG